MTVAAKVAEEILMNKSIVVTWQISIFGFSNYERLHPNKEWYEDEEVEWDGKDEEDAEEEGVGGEEDDNESVISFVTKRRVPATVD
ncbi:hypothetical protein niasHT_029824 [Heterodera trifolii]|uniref:Uncharacterized protein n=1 Tax=Heterodera trifolii TaxID=157864 RepID=A0ABD2K0Q2_9BILA